MRLHCWWLPGVAAAAFLSLGPLARADQTIVEPDNYADGTDISTAVAGVTLSTIGGPSANHSVYAATSFDPSNNVFGWFKQPGWISSTWNFDYGGGVTSPDFRADFTSFMASEVSMDANTENGATLSAFDSGGGLLGATTGSGTLTFTSGAANIQYITLATPDRSAYDVGYFDHLVITHSATTSAVPEPGSLALLLGPGLAGLGLHRRRRK